MTRVGIFMVELLCRSLIRVSLSHVNQIPSSLWRIVRRLPGLLASGNQMKHTID